MGQNTAGRTETASEYSADALGIDGGLVYNAIHWSTIYNQSMSAKRIEMLSGIVLGEICFKNEWRRQ